MEKLNLMIKKGPGIRLKSSVPWLFLSLYLVCFSAFTVFAASGKASIRFSKRVHDFGDVKQHTVVSHRFSFENRGNGLLVIEKVKAG